jgi:hypothetical protein
MTTATLQIAIFIPVPVLSGAAVGVLATVAIRLLGGRGSGGQSDRDCGS